MKRENEEYGIGLVRSTSFGSKRVALSSSGLDFGDDDDDDRVVGRRKRRCLRYSIEDLPQEIMIRILCGVEHGDLKSLFFVSRAVREAALVAKKSHFAFGTPRKHPVVLDEDGDEAPNAPKQSRNQRPRLSAKKLADISVNLFV